jgi:Cu/Zn superoxide dismutase
MTRSLALALAMAGMLGAAGAGLAEAAGPVIVQLTPQNNSGETGTATLTEQGTKTKVVVGINGAPAGVAQPLHVHKGTCAKLDPKPTYGLTTLTDGKSETTIDVSLNALQTGGFAINGHKSAQDANTYVFCGNIPGSS